VRSDLEPRLIRCERLATIALSRALKARDKAGQVREWIMNTSGASEPQPDCVADFSAVCPCFPSVITLADSYYGDCPLSYDQARLAWFGCKLVSLPANLSCTAVASFALHYTLSGNNTSTSWALVLQYKTANFTTRCPVASTCADATNQALNLVITVHCSGTSSVSFTVNGTVPGTQCYPAFRNVTLSFTLP
jgi:hypothetical protein